MNNFMVIKVKCSDSNSKGQKQFVSNQCKEGTTGHLRRFYCDPAKSTLQLWLAERKNNISMAAFDVHNGLMSVFDRDIWGKKSDSLRADVA